MGFNSEFKGLSLFWILDVCYNIAIYLHQQRQTRRICRHLTFTLRKKISRKILKAFKQTIRLKSLTTFLCRLHSSTLYYRRRQQFPPLSSHLSAERQCVTSQQTPILVLPTLRTPNTTGLSNCTVGNSAHTLKRNFELSYNSGLYPLNVLRPSFSDVILLTLRLLMSYIYIYIYIYIYGAPILDVSRSHTMTHHSR